MRPEVWTRRFEDTAVTFKSFLPSLQHIFQHVQRAVAVKRREAPQTGRESPFRALQCRFLWGLIDILWSLHLWLCFVFVFLFFLSRRMVGGWCTQWLYMCMFVHTCSPRSRRKNTYSPRSLGTSKQWRPDKPPLGNNKIVFDDFFSHSWNGFPYFWSTELHFILFFFQMLSNGITGTPTIWSLYFHLQAAPWQMSVLKPCRLFKHSH